MKRSLFAAAAMMFLTTPALSQIRCNVEASVGMGFAVMNIDRSMDGFNTGSNDMGAQNFVGGLGAGCDWHAQYPFVIGILARYNFADLSGTEKEEEYKVGDFWSAGVRLGYQLNNSVMLYGVAGWTGTDISRVGHAGNWRPEASANGLWLGGGVELSLTDNWAGRLEYSWHDFETVNLQPPHVSTDLHVVRAALVYRFGSGGGGGYGR
jgi:opacity protein-like surface antigen